MRILLLIAIGLMVYMIIKRLMNDRTGNGLNKSAESQESSDLVKCQHCGVHILQPEAIQSAVNPRHYYCCVEHKNMDEMV